VRILHISDTHGLLPELRTGADIIVHSGDFLPNRTRGVRAIEEPFQAQWIRDNADRLKAWLGGRPFLFCQGNHDFIDPVPELKEAGINAIDLTMQYIVEHNGVRFFGFPWVKYFTGEWNWEAEERDIVRHLRLVPPVDVLVTHGPIYGVLDQNIYRTRCGSQALKDFLRDVPTPPKYVLHGHIHEAAGHTGWSRGIIVSNAAGIQQVWEIS